jgi:hypothetical protein
MSVAAKPSWFSRLKGRYVPSKREVVEKLSKAVHWSDRHIPPGVRTLAGIPLMIGGVFSFLPLLGLWMLPLGAALIALDFPGLRRRMLDWIERQELRHGLQPQPRRKRR